MNASIAFLNARTLAAETRFKVFPSGPIWTRGAKDAATDDPQILDAMNRIDPAANWRVRCSVEDGLLILDTPTDADWETMKAQLDGPPPLTPMSTRKGGGTHRWYRVSPDVTVTLGVALFKSRALFKFSALIPGSRHRKNGEPQAWRGFTPKECAIADVPEEWLGEAGGIPVTRRWEWQPNHPNGGGWSARHTRKEDEFDQTRLHRPNDKAFRHD